MAGTASGGLTLSERDRATLAGKAGPAPKLAMRVLVRMAEVRGAEKLMAVEGAHIDSTIYVGDAGLEFAERLAGLGARVVVPSTLNVSGVDEFHWREWAVPTEWAAKATRQMRAYAAMGTIPTWTCAPYQTPHLPRFGQQIAWGESNAVAFANSVLGARTERYPDLLDICCAITGRVPAVGLHLDENRLATRELRLVGIPETLAGADDFYPVLGHLLGPWAEDEPAVITGLPVVPDEDQLKALGAAAASSGAVALFHIPGVTPEAPTVEAALGGRAPREVRRIGVAELAAARRELTTRTDGPLDLVVLGSPHFSFDEIRKLAAVLDAEGGEARCPFLVTTSRAVRDLAERAGLLAPLVAFGGQVTVDTCILATPMLAEQDGPRRLMTNSAKYAWYSPGLLEAEVAFGSLEECVASARAGEIVRRPGPWDRARAHQVAGRETDVVAPRRSDPSAGPTATREATSVQCDLLAGSPAEGLMLASGDPLSFWGGYDAETGRILDTRHPLAGRIASGRVLALPATRGSSTTTAVLLEAIRRGTAPAALVTRGRDAFLALACTVGEELYGRSPALAAVGAEAFATLSRWASARVEPGRIVPGGGKVPPAEVSRTPGAGTDRGS